ncbi:DMT family transporter [Dyella tabacisoli]|uniref:EamA/RhaT family transporter n=1 Tax=Dyella tabacisoli TaxID=2282381 RepID=A0A369UMW1_9GAMM|nr:DMT family transporter [Dyella tabacisoli]RDD82104.1 EamA/RhaT family transporter [Dyella tabacisoli]
MKRSDIAALLLLGALWGASFLFMRMGADAFGSMPLAGLRAIGAALCFAPMLASRRYMTELRAHWRPIAVVGLTNSALPYVLFSYAAQSLPAGLSAIFDAITPLLVAASGWLWLSEKLDTPRILGLLIGLAGVLWLVGDTAGLGHGNAHAGWAMAACVGATVCYAFSVHYSHRRLRTVSPMSTTAGSQIVAALLLTPSTIWQWPAQTPSTQAWLAMLGLAVACTAVAYLLFFRLIARVGAARSMTVLYLIPAFGVLWGTLFLGETFTMAMAVGCVVILLGTALTTGLIRFRPTTAAGTVAAVEET